jgi:hypothetical protein
MCRSETIISRDKNIKRGPWELTFTRAESQRHLQSLLGTNKQNVMLRPYKPNTRAESKVLYARRIIVNYSNTGQIDINKLCLAKALCSLKGVKLLVCNSNPQLMHALESRTYFALDAQARSTDMG